MYRPRPLLGERVLVKRTAVGGGDLLEHVVGDELLQSRGEDVAGDAEALLELAESPLAGEGFAQDEQ